MLSIIHAPLSNQCHLLVHKEKVDLFEEEAYRPLQIRREGRVWRSVSESGRHIRPPSRRSPYPVVGTWNSGNRVCLIKWSTHRIRHFIIIIHARFLRVSDYLHRTSRLSLCSFCWKMCPRLYENLQVNFHSRFPKLFLEFQTLSVSGMWLEVFTFQITSSTTDRGIIMLKKVT